MIMIILDMINKLDIIKLVWVVSVSVLVFVIVPDQESTKDGAW